MWPSGGGGYYWPQAPANNPTPQQSEPSEWAAKAAQWAQQKSIQEQQAYQQQLAQYQQQQQQMLAVQQQQQQQQYQQQQAYQAPAPPPTQATPPQPKPLFESGGPHSSSGPGNIEQPPRSAPPPNRYGPPEGGYRGRGGRPPQFQRGGGYRGGPRGGMRPRVPIPPGPRGHPPHQWEQPDMGSPGNYGQRQESFVNDAPTEEYYQSQESGIPDRAHHNEQFPDRAHHGVGTDRGHWGEEQSIKKEQVDKDKVKPFNDEDLYAKAPEPEIAVPIEAPPSKPPEPKPVKNEDRLYANSARQSGPTIASLQSKRESTIPGLGEITIAQTTAAEPLTTERSEQPKSDQDKMLASLGKLVTELQGLKGLTSSLQLLQSLPRAGEKESEELAKKKAAALLANESDSEGESQPPAKKEPAPEPQPTYADNEPIRSQDAREFEGYSVKPQVYGTYSQEGYPETERAPDYRGREEYPHKYEDRGYEYPEGRRPPPERFYPPNRRYEDHPPGPEPYQEREWMESQEYSRGYRDGDRLPPDERYPPREQFPHGERYPSDERYPPPDLSSRERFPPGDERFRREGGRFPPPEMPPAREGRFPDGPLPRDRRFQGEEFHRPPPARDPYGYGGHVPPAGRDGYKPQERPSFSAAQIESFDYGHGDRAPAIVDYNHGKGGVVTEQPPDHRGQGSSEGFPPGPPAEAGYTSVPGYGGFPSAMPYFPAGVDPAHAALIAAAFSAQQAGESKRKVLPAWLRDELEKMEAKRQKELDKETKKNEGTVREGRGTWRDELESDEEEADKKEEKKGWSKRTYRQKSSSPRSSKTEDGPPPGKRKRNEPAAMDDEEEKEVTKIMKIRRLLTEILLEVTDQEIDVVAMEVLEEENKPKLSFPFKKPASNQPPSEGVLAELRKYDSDSDSDQEDKKKGRDKPQVDPLAIAKAFADTVADVKLGPVPPPSKEHQEWADKLLSNLTPRSRKDSSRKHSKSEEKRSDRRSSGDEYSKRSSHKKDKDSRSKSSSHGHKSSDSPISSKRSARRSHSPPPPSGMSLMAGFPPPKVLSVRGGSPSPTRRRGRRSRSRSHSPKRKVSYDKDRSRSRSPSRSSRSRHDKIGSGKKSSTRWSDERSSGSTDSRGKSASWVGGRPPGKGSSSSQRKSPTWSGGRAGGGADYRIVTRK